MASFRQLIIFGAAITLSTLVLSNPSPTVALGSEFEECQTKGNEQGEILKECISKEFTAAELNETIRMYNGTKCVRCKHFCRKQPEVMNCTRETTESLKVLSNKSRSMVPFLGHLIEETFSSFCENDTEILTVFVDEENGRCFRRTENACPSHMEFVEDPDVVALCDSPNTENDPYNEKYVCQKLIDYLECKEKDVVSCSTDVQNVVASLISKLRNTESCAQYYEE